MWLGAWDIDEYLTFPINTHDPSNNGAATDADAVPTYRIYEDETGTSIINGSSAKLDDDNTTGFYTERIQLTSANGFEAGKCYTIYIQATVDSIVGTMAHTFKIRSKVDTVERKEYEERLLSYCDGAIDRNDNVLSYKKQDGSTTKSQHTIDTDGRSVSH